LSEFTPEISAKYVDASTSVVVSIEAYGIPGKFSMSVRYGDVVEWFDNLTLGPWWRRWLDRAIGFVFR
jgi:hypothetical protein